MTRKHVRVTIEGWMSDGSGNNRWNIWKDKEFDRYRGGIYIESLNDDDPEIKIEELPEPIELQVGHTYKYFGDVYCSLIVPLVNGYLVKLINHSYEPYGKLPSSYDLFDHKRWTDVTTK
jgi:hypothetical protein